MNTKNANDSIDTIDLETLALVNGGNDNDGFGDQVSSLWQAGVNGLTNVGNFLREHPITIASLEFSVGGDTAIPKPYTNDPLTDATTHVVSGQPVPAR